MGINKFIFKIEIPKFLSFMTLGNFDGYVPGIKDYIYGNENLGILSGQEKIDRGKYARLILKDLKFAKESNDTSTYAELERIFNSQEFRDEYFAYFGYGFFNDVKSLVPNVPITFYSFHIMVILGFYFLTLMVVMFISTWNGWLVKHRWLLWIALWSIPLPYIASQAGWIVAEVGRQPWIIQDLLPTMAAVSNIDASSVQITFWMFAVLFTVLLIAEVSIMTKQIKLGPNKGGH